MKVKIIGAGSIGNHLAQAARRMEWEVTVVDSDPLALKRMKEEIYPKRYGVWDDSIKLLTSQEEEQGSFDIICIGTPPDSHMDLALRALEEKPKILQIEKPLSTPLLTGLEEFLLKYYNQKETVAIVGYDHAISQSIGEVVRLLGEGTIGAVQTIDVEFREHWQGIFSAHHWLSGPQDSYLGFWQRGGGAASEHSHALHLWQFLAKKSRLGRWVKVSSFMDMKDNNGLDYDAISSFSLLTERNKIGRVIQDVITLPVHKWLRIQADKGFIEWICGGHPEGDLLRYGISNSRVEEKIFRKKRPDDFYLEMLHMKDILDKNISVSDSPLSLESAVAVMQVINKSHVNRNQSFEITT